MVFLAWTLFAATHAATYYVDPKGADTNLGTVASPFATPQQGLDAAHPGDTVRLLPGVYHGRVVFPRSGEAGKPIVLEGVRPLLPGGPGAQSGRG